MTDAIRSEVVTTRFRNRIVGHGSKSPEDFLANPDNWRIHPIYQQEALTGALEEVGWVQTVLENVQTGHMIDGHLRVLLADREGETQVPVTYVDLTPEEERVVLATLDPLSALAEQDSLKLGELLAETRSAHAGLGAMLQQLREQVTAPSFRELQQTHDGEYEEEHFWPMVRLRTHPRVYDAWREWVQQCGGKDSDAFHKAMQATGADLPDELPKIDIPSGEDFTLDDDLPGQAERLDEDG